MVVHVLCRFFVCGWVECCLTLGIRPADVPTDDSPMEPPDLETDDAYGAYPTAISAFAATAILNFQLWHMMQYICHEVLTLSVFQRMNGCFVRPLETPTSLTRQPCRGSTPPSEKASQSHVGVSIQH